MAAPLMGDCWEEGRVAAPLMVLMGGRRGDGLRMYHWQAAPRCREQGVAGPLLHRDRDPVAVPRSGEC